MPEDTLITIFLRLASTFSSKASAIFSGPTEFTLMTS